MKMSIKRSIELSGYVVGLTFIICGCSLVDGGLLPTDEQMKNVFSRNKDDFEKIVRMSNEDRRLTNVRYKFTVVDGKGSSLDTGDAGITDERWREYKRLFKKIGLDSGILRGKDGSVTFLASGEGIAPSGIAKGYIFSTSETPRGNFRCSSESLDLPERLTDIWFACKKIDENWYLFLSR